MLFTYTSGQPTSPAIVFLHGGGLSGRMWQPQFERLASDYYCLAPDLPEQGKSIAAGPFRLEDAARQVLALLDEYVPGRRVHLVGLSLGADLALVIMKLAPQSIDHVVVSAAAPLGKTLGNFTLALAGLPINHLFFKQQLKLAASMFGILPQYREMFYEDMLLATTPAFTRRSIEALIELPQLLPRESSAPTLVVVGERERGIAKQAAQTVVASLRNAQGMIVPGVNHVWNLQAPDLFSEVVRAWIEDQPLPTALRPLPVKIRNV